MTSILENLSPEQANAVIDLGKKKCILAGAGSGKTGTLVSSIVRDISSGVIPENIVAFTFTEKAAGELLSRIHFLSKKHLPQIDISGIFVGTIHGWCFQFLKKRQKFRGFDSLDDLQVDALVSRLYDQLNLERIYNKPYPKGIKDFLVDFEIYQNEGISLIDAPERIREALSTFTRVLHQNKLLTFGCMIRSSCEELLLENPSKEIHILYVDEYQDVNPSQVILIKRMISDNTRLVVVGDDLQSIYNWRGSDVTRILNFSEDFNPSLIKRLSSNYRSRPKLVEFCNQVAENIILRDPQKIMNPVRMDAQDECVYWLSTNGEKEEVNQVAELVIKLKSNGVPLNNIAILLRSVLGSGNEFREELIQRGVLVNCSILTRSIEIIDSFFVPLFRWLQKDISEPRNEEEENEITLQSIALWENTRVWMQNQDQESELVFWEEVSQWCDLVITNNSEAYNVRGMLYNLLDKVGIKVNEESPELLMGLSIASQIIRSVEEIHRRRLKGYERRTPRGIISEVIVSLTRNSKSFGESLSIEPSNDGVLITTIHQSKGLEWPVVIIPRLKARKFPVQIPQGPNSFPDSISKKYSTSIQDEYRLFYVACTRAKEKLFLFDPCANNEKGRSLFLKVMVEQKKKYSPKNIFELSDNDFRVEMVPESTHIPLKIGLSDLIIYLICPFQYALSKIAGIQPAVGDELGYGKSLHELIQTRIEDGENWDARKLDNEGDNSIHLPLLSEKAEKVSKIAIKKRVHLLQELGAFAFRSFPEVEIEVSIGGSIITGIIDGVIDSGVGKVIILDWKSSIHEDFLCRYEKQLRFYAYALRNKDENVVKAELVDVSETFSKRQLVKREVDISPAMIKELIAEIEAGVQGLKSKNFKPKPSKVSCGSCDMQRVCFKSFDHEETFLC